MKHTIFSILCILPLAIMAMSNGRNTKSILRDGSNQFTARMFSEVTNANPEKSVVLSAISVMPPLAQLALASVGESHDEILQAIGTPNDETAKAVFSYANKELQSSEGVTVKTANRIYIGKDYELNADFAALSREVFNSEVKHINFREKVKAATEINTWVEDQTNHLIKNLVDPKSLDSNTKTLLVNAIYFKGTWKEQFEKELTTEKDFHVNKNEVTRVPMMHRTGDYRYVESDELNSQIIEIPYEKDHASFVVVLPKDVEGIVELEEKLKDSQVLDSALKNSFVTKVIVDLPKFKIETTTNMKDVLEKMNVSKVFKTNEAKLYNLLKNVDDIFIGLAVQKALIDVNEEGAEAAAAWAASAISVVSGYIGKPKHFNANRPFYFAIKLNSLTLFNGVMYGS